MIRNRTARVKVRYSRAVTDDMANRLRRDVDYLCSRECAGREAGSAEGLAARKFIVKQLNEAGWTPTIQPVPGCRGANVIAHKPGKGKTVLVAAHYDHIGRAMGDDAYWGADDNAAAVAVVLELARRHDHAKDDHDLMLVAFDGEEPPHFLTDEMGSIRFTQQPPIPLEDIAVAIVLDLVGHSVGPPEAPSSVRDLLFVLGGEKAENLTKSVLAASFCFEGLTIRPLDLDIVPPLSDYEPFRRNGVPALFLTGGRWRHYHELTDTPDKLDFRKIESTVEFVEQLARECTMPLGRYEPDARAWATSARTLHAVASELVDTCPQAQGIVTVLDRLIPTIQDGGSIGADEYSALLTALMQLEELIA